MDFRMPFYYYGDPRVTGGMKPNMNPRYGYERRKDEQRNQNIKNEPDRRQQASQNQRETRKEEVEKPSDTRAINREGEPIFEIFGIKLYFDDLLIIALIFFLYNEGVSDNLLFISLVLLLLS